MTANEPAGWGPTARRMVLGGQLRRLRERANIGRAEAGFEIRSSESKISRIELGRVSFKERDIRDLLTMYGVADETERQQFLDLIRQSNQPGWWNGYSDLIPTWFNDYVGLEEAAARIQTYEVLFVPGLLQTEEYARAITGYGLVGASNDELDRRVALRIARQKLLAGPNAPRLWAVLDESVLYRPIGGRNVLRNQLERLLEITDLPHVTLQIVPFKFGGYTAESAFTLLRFAEEDLPDIVYIEHLSGSLYVDKAEEVELYSQTAHRLAVDAETPDHSRQLLRKTISEL
ncbi:helix-turn-helix protein [Tamaricihabitans halophyticus]|uniref:Helix-turn-helix protein n=1 Tax=Tamaricihabitans halophyticus TaxID=1262583 RepID=A0A4R2QJ22_9PSEU|nr:helix-turn-helix transcriptional regulator [Tamaricihabitans halophyticus]TCP49363.1 helix-turn-helix protein [Tamaricihabitans halophyticus]